MSFISDTVLSGSTQLHIARGGHQPKDDRARSTQTPAGRFEPLVRLVKDPFSVLAGARHVETAPAAEDEEARKQLLYLRMQEAESYDEWKAAATELDTLEGNDAWKLQDESSEYDAELVKARLEQLDEARVNCDVKRMLYLVRTTLTRGLGGMGDLRLYKHSHVGTKKLIERYIDSAVQTLAALPDVAEKQGDSCPVKPDTVAQELLRTRQSFGRTALLLSGGGTFGMNHIGVVKCLWELHLLPRIISGASAGSIVCAVLCSKTDKEIPSVLHNFCYGDLAVFEKPGEEGVIQKVTRFLKYGSLYDISHLQRILRQLLGDITFQESYNRTRRILSITVSSASMYELPKLLNYVTAPDVMIWSAVCASCSVPFVFSASCIMAKDRKTGKEVPWDPTPNAGFIDGSVDNDLPMTRLAELFNVNHFIVSQVNPHVVPFLAKEEEAISEEAQQNTAFSAGSSWMHHMASFAKGEALHRLEVLAEMGFFPNTMTKVRSVLNQRYSGDITIFPAISYTNFPKILSNPTTEYMLRCLLTGEQATWPKVSRIQNHVAVELALDEAVTRILPCVHFSQSPTNLRPLNCTRPVSQGADRPQRGHQRASHSESHNIPLAPFTRFAEISSHDFTSREDTCAQGSFQTADKPYLPSRSSTRNHKRPDITRVAFAPVEAISSTDPDNSSPSSIDADADVSGNDGSDTSDVLSSSPPPRAHVRSPSADQILFPFRSVSIRTAVAPASGNQCGYPDLHAPCNGPSSPETRYKHIFHPPITTHPPGAPHLQPAYKQGIERILQPLSSISSSRHTVSNPEHIEAAQAGPNKTENLDGDTGGAFDGFAFNPLATKKAEKENQLGDSYFERKRRSWDAVRE